MKKRLLIVICLFLVLGLCACGNKQDSEVAKEVTADEASDDNGASATAEPEQPEPQEETLLGEEQQFLGDISLEKEVTQEEEPVLQQDPKVFEEITTELTTYPIIKYTIMGEQKQMDYTMYETIYPYNMVSEAEYAIGYSTGDVTGDEVEELIVSIYVVGNTLTDTLQDTYVYCVDADINDLKEILYISAQGGEQFVAGYPNNVGACPSGNGTLQLSLSTMKDENQETSLTITELIYQDGMWGVK